MKRIVFALAAASIILGSCGGAKDGKPADVDPIKGKTFKVEIVMDTVDLWSSGVKDGFVSSLDAALAARGAKAEYTTDDTKLDPAIAAKVKDKIVAEKPDLVCTIVYPDGFSNVRIAQELKGPSYRFVSMDAVALQDGTISSYEKPGGNITGVGVFIQMNSVLKLAKKIDPDLKSVFFYSWDKMGFVNQWFVSELDRACAEEGLRFEHALLADSEAEFAMYDKLSASPENILALVGVSAFLDRAGKPVDMKAKVPDYYREHGRFLVACYEDVLVGLGFPFGTVVSWEDIGRQLSDKAVLVLAGADPGSIVWEYPRKFSVMINLPALKRLGYAPSQDIIDSSSRVYTNYTGHYAGKP